GYWQPLLAGWTPDTGWNTGEILTRGDPVFTNIAFFSIELTAPTSIVFATTGIASEVSVEGESTTYHWSSGAVRDFVMIANQAFTTLEAQVGETLVRSFTTPDSASVAQDALDIAVAALRFFNERVGVFPYREFDMAQSDLGPRAAGIEFPALIYISENLYTPENFSLVFTIVHEVAHQYWYNLIGNNQYQHAFLDESLANYTAVLYLEAAYGEEVAEMAIDRYLTRTYLATLFGNDGDAIVDQPTADFISDLAYGRIVYGKGAIGMHQIRQAIGLEAFFAGLALYLDEHAYGVVNPVDLRTAFQEASGQNLEALWVHWFDETNGLQDFTPDSIIEIR
ncbi:MAG: M1 family aminopeptidase, partial [Thermomicrobiales bacterium]